MKKQLLALLILLFALFNEAAFGAAPVITTFAPTSGAVGTTVTITGTDFDATAANNIVFFGAVKATVTAATAPA